MPSIDGKRLLGDLKRIREFGRYETGVHRPCFSDQDMESRHWLAARMAEAGLMSTIDGVGNVIGRSTARGPCLLMGSHTDTQPRSGWLDGAMGVICALEVARAFRNDPACANFGVDVASWADEEGHYGPPSFLGSRSFIGALNEDDIDRAKHREDGTPLRKALERAGLAGCPRLALEEGRYMGYLEAHIEQGGTLELERKRIGVVTAIVGIFNYRVVFEGERNHAGTTPMRLRKDAGVALIRFASALHERLGRIAGPLTVWTVGRISVEPGVLSIIPGRAEMRFQFRDPSPEILDRFAAAVNELVAEADRQGPCHVRLEMLSQTPPVVMDADFQDALEAVAREHVHEATMRMPSGAGHDAQMVARRLRAGMLFVPSIGGVSHHYTEDTLEEDIILGCQVFASWAARILRG